MYGGSVVSCATQERATVTLTQSESLELITGEHRLVVQGPDDLRLQDDWLDLQRAAIRHFRLDPAEFLARIEVSTGVPKKAGLAGSTAIAVALTAGLYAWLGRPLNRYLIAENARRIEWTQMGVVCGFQDQYMAAFGGLNYIDCRNKERLAQDDAEPYATVEPLGERVAFPPLVLAHTGVQRNSGQVHASPRERWEQGDPAVRKAFEDIGRIGQLGKKALVHEDWAYLGHLMSENHQIVRDLGMSNEDNERLISAALDAGCYGAKLAGAGKGGTIVALAPDLQAAAGSLTRAGAKSILYPALSPGVTVDIN